MLVNHSFSLWKVVSDCQLTYIFPGCVRCMVIVLCVYLLLPGSDYNLQNCLLVCDCRTIHACAHISIISSWEHTKKNKKIKKYLNFFQKAPPQQTKKHANTSQLCTI